MDLPPGCAVPPSSQKPQEGGDELLRPPKEDGPVQLEAGLVLGGQWKIIKKLGEGGCGAVYLVSSTLSGNKMAALKAESLFVEGGSVLKIEVDVLSKLVGKKHVCEYLGAGRLEKYQYIVMSLLGESLEGMIRLVGNICSSSTQLRVGVHVLHGLKQIHDAGFVHRDIKPANLALGRRDGGTDPNFIYILDFGLSRSFLDPKDDGKGKRTIRKPRRSALFRGTVRYCSVAAHLKHDQSRVDDIWSLLYLMIEMRGRLPWSELGEHKELAEAKSTVTDRDLFGECAGQLIDFSRYLKTLDYFSKPDYPKMYTFLMDGMRDGGYKFSDPWDWQIKELQLAEKARVEKASQAVARGIGGGGGGGGGGVGGGVGGKLGGLKTKISMKSKKSNVRTAKSIAEPKTGRPARPKAAAPSVMGAPPKADPVVEVTLPDATPFTMADFTADPIGI